MFGGGCSRDGYSIRDGGLFLYSFWKEWRGCISQASCAIDGSFDFHVFVIRNQFIRNLVLKSLKFKILLELQGKT